MTSPMNVPVGGCGDAPPAGDPNHRIGYHALLLDDLILSASKFLEALDGNEFEQEHAREFFEKTIQFCKDHR